MNYKTAVKILEIDIEKEELNNNIIKKKYRMLALQFHPDKNNTEYARTKFHDIQNAYEFLTKNNKSEDDDIDSFLNEQTYSYKDLLGIFLKSLLEEGGFGNNINDVQFKIYQNILQKISRLCEERTIELLKNINKNLLIKIYEVLFKYQSVLYISDVLLIKIREVLDEQMKNDECIILHPILEDLFDHNIYKLNYQERTMLIPLWHHELVYDISGADLYVRCFPILSDNVSIDSNNNISVDLQYDIRELLSKEEIKIDLGGHRFCFNVEDLRVVPQQTAILKGAGIPSINSKDIFSINERSNLMLNIRLI
jgi:hypothetical protein